MIYHFYINQNEEIEVLNDMLSDGGGNTVSERAQQYHIPLDIASSCQKGRISSSLRKYMNDEYLDKKADLEKALRYHQEFWNQKGQEYGDKISKVLGDKLPNFYVRLDICCGGTSDWYGNHISINAFEHLSNPSAFYATLLWESILAFTFQYVRKIYSDKNYSDAVVWAVSEMTSCSIINEEFPIIWKIGYNQLSPHQDQIIKMYRNRSSFSDFIDLSLQYFAKFSHELNI